MASSVFTAGRAVLGFFGSEGNSGGNQASCSQKKQASKRSNDAGLSSLLVRRMAVCFGHDLALTAKYL
jgi:hypothetical protein